MRTRILLSLALPLALLTAGPATAATAPTPVATITVAGTGTVTVERDRATTQFGMSVVGRTSTVAKNDLALLVTRVRTAVLSSGAKATDLTTTSLSLQPEYEWPKEATRPVIVGYRAALSMSVRSTVDAASDRIDAALAAGGDAVTVNGIWFDSTKGAAAAATARARAITDARAKATQYAKAAGVAVGRVLTITETGAPSYGPIWAKGATEDARLPLDSGSQDVTATVTVVFLLR